MQGIKIGAVIGGGATALLFGGAYLGSSAANKDPTPIAVFAASGALVGALYGVLIGAVVGAERWTTVYSMPARLSFVPSPAGAPGIGVRFRF